MVEDMKSGRRGWNRPDTSLSLLVYDYRVNDHHYIPQILFYCLLTHSQEYLHTSIKLNSSILKELKSNSWTTILQILVSKLYKLNHIAYYYF